MTTGQCKRFDFRSCLPGDMKVIILAGMLLLALTSCRSEKGNLNDAKKNTEASVDTVVRSSESVPQKAMQTEAGSGRLEYSEPEDIRYNIADIPAELRSRIEGKVVFSASFTDSNGRNFVIITETPETERGEFREKRIYGYQFAGERLEQVWKIQDYITECEFDVTVSFIEGSLSITDLDKNGVAESVFLYKLSCKSDVSPDDMKLIMHEGSSKYAIRGVMDLDMESYGRQEGSMKIDASFNSAPEVFREYAVKQWNRHKVERVGY